MMFSIRFAVACTFLRIHAHAITVFPYAIGTKKANDGDKTDELYLHIKSKDCSRTMTACSTQGQPTLVLGEGISTNGSIEFKMEERDTINNDHSNTVLLSQAQLSEMDAYLLYVSIRNKDITMLRFTIHFFFSDDLSSFIQDVPMKDMMCVSPVGGIKAWKAFKVAKAAGELAGYQSEAANQIEDALSVCADEVFPPPKANSVQTLLLDAFSDKLFKEEFRNTCVPVFEERAKEVAKSNEGKDEACKLTWTENTNRARFSAIHASIVMACMLFATQMQ